MKTTKQAVLFALVACLSFVNQNAKAGLNLGLPKIEKPKIKLPRLELPKLKLPGSKDPQEINKYLSQTKRQQGETFNAALAFARFLNSRDPKAVKIRKALRKKDYKTANGLLQSEPKFLKLASEAREKKFKTITVGVGADASLIIGGAVEIGVAIDLTGDNPTFKGYTTTIGSIGISAGVDGTVAVGWWKAENDEIAGKGYGVVGALSAAVSVNFGAWFDKKDDRNKFYKRSTKPNGYSLALGAGVGAEIGEFDTATTRQKDA